MTFCLIVLINLVPGMVLSLLINLPIIGKFFNNNSSIMIHNINKLFKFTSIEHLINNIPNRGRHRVNN